MRVEVWFQDEARIGQKNTLTRVWGQTGSRPAAPKDLGFASAYVFGAVCPSQGKAAALIMPICNTAAMNHHLSEISSQVAPRPMPCWSSRLPRRRPGRRLARQPGAGDTRQHYLVGVAALQPKSSLRWSASGDYLRRSHWLANSVFPSLADIMDACEMAWNRFAGDPGSVRAPSPGRPVVAPWTYTSAIHPDPIISGDPYKNLTFATEE